MTGNQAKYKRAVTIQWILEWAFRKECATLDLPDETPVELRPTGYGMEYVLIERAKLGGVKIDTSIGKSYPHDDAETVAAIVANLGNQFGGRRSAILVAEFSKKGTTPDWMPNAIPKLEPIDWIERAGKPKSPKTAVDRFETVRLWDNKANRYRRTEVAVKYTPCTLRPDPSAIKSARKLYSEWWIAINAIRIDLIASNMLREFAITNEMPKSEPWLKGPLSGSHKGK